MAATIDPTQRRTGDIALQAAPAAMPPGLRHSDDTRPGYTRRREKDGFAYFDVSGKRIDDAREIARINALAIPPAYQDVWICPDAHLPSRSGTVQSFSSTPSRKRRPIANSDTSSAISVIVHLDVVGQHRIGGCEDRREQQRRAPAEIQHVDAEESQ